MVQDLGDGEPLCWWQVVLDIVCPHQHLESGGEHDGGDVSVEGAVGRSQHMAGRDEGTSTKRDILSSQHHGNLGLKIDVNFVYHCV